MSSDQVDQKARSRDPASFAGDATAGRGFVAERAHVAPAPSLPERQAAASRGSAIRTLLHVVRNAAITVCLLTLVPVGIVAVRGDDVMRRFTWSEHFRQRIQASDRVRFLAVPKDPSITPLAAGHALVSLTRPGETSSGGFQENTSLPRVAVPWDSLKLAAAGMFVGATPTVYSTPFSTVLQAAAARRLSPAERAYVHAIAALPLWREVGIVARAPAVDILGARFQFPLRPDARWEEMPVLRTSQLREIGNASVSRAAWFLDRGQRDSAEATLLTTISFGLALIDNASTMTEHQSGLMVVGLGREGMRELYTAVGDPAATSKALAVLTAADFPARPRLTSDQLRPFLMARINDPSAPRAERIASMLPLTLSPCTNVRELLFGPSDDVRDALATARRTLPRFASERAILDLPTRMPDIRSRELGGAGPVVRTLVSASVAAGTVLRNPRLGTCALVAGGMRIEP